MSPSKPGRNHGAKVFAAAAASLVADDDAIGTITALMVGCVEAVSAESAGLVIKHPDGSDRLELLASTSHRAEELELYQLQNNAGPCVEAVTTGESILIDGAQAMAQRWPDLGEGFLKARYAGVRATPLRWHGTVLGALNIFWSGRIQDEDDADLVQGFADVATIAIVHAGWISPVQLIEQTRLALAGRAVIEQAKGVLAQRENLDVSAAFSRLLSIAVESRLSLSAAAAKVIDEAAAGGRPRAAAE